MLKSYTRLKDKYKQGCEKLKFANSKDQRGEILSEIHARIKKLERILAASDQVAAFEEPSKLAVSRQEVNNLRPVAGSQEILGLDEHKNEAPTRTLGSQLLQVKHFEKRTLGEELFARTALLFGKTVACQFGDGCWGWFGRHLLPHLTSASTPLNADYNRFIE